jgi:hypothetical protein
MAVVGDHVQAGTGRKLRYWATFGRVAGHFNLVAFAATISEGDRLLGKPDGEFYCKRGLTIEEAVRLHLKQHIDATQFAEGTGPDEAWYRSPVHFGPYR